MNLALDASYSFGSELSGVGVYSREILRALAQIAPQQRFRWLYRPRFRKPEWARDPPNVARGVLWDFFGWRRGLFHGLNQRLPRFRYPVQVATFHDLFVMTGDYSTQEFRSRFLAQARHAALHADRIIAVSQFTADQVHDLLAVPRDRIRVVRHGVVPRPLPDVPRERMVLSVGAIQTRKNTARLIKAFLAMPKDWKLVLAGSAGFGSETILAQAAGHPRIRVTGYISDQELAQLYAQASLFAFPSLDEGFGMPVLEAMAAGVPVITSNQSALPEVAGDAAILVDPFDVSELSAALCDLANNPEKRNQLIQKGRTWAEQFTWIRAARETLAVYRELA